MRAARTRRWAGLDARPTDCVAHPRESGEETGQPGPTSARSRMGRRFAHQRWRPRPVNARLRRPRGARARAGVSGEKVAESAETWAHPRRDRSSGSMRAAGSRRSAVARSAAVRPAAHRRVPVAAARSVPARSARWWARPLRGASARARPRAQARAAAPLRVATDCSAAACCDRVATARARRTHRRCRCADPIRSCRAHRDRCPWTRR